jgi:hypothetical protein
MIVQEEREAKSKMPHHKGLERFKLLDKMGECVLSLSPPRIALISIQWRLLQRLQGDGLADWPKSGQYVLHFLRRAFDDSYLHQSKSSENTNSTHPRLVPASSFSP